MKIFALHESSMIQSSVYDTENQDLLIKFKTGMSYKFESVTEEDYQLFANSESTGKGFNSHIRKYNGVKMITEVADEYLRNHFLENVEGTSKFNQSNQLNEISTN